MMREGGERLLEYPPAKQPFPEEADKKKGRRQEENIAFSQGNSWISFLIVSGAHPFNEMINWIERTDIINAIVDVMKRNSYPGSHIHHNHESYEYQVAWQIEYRRRDTHGHTERNAEKDGSIKRAKGDGQPLWHHVLAEQPQDHSENNADRTGRQCFQDNASEDHMYGEHYRKAQSSLGLNKSHPGYSRRVNTQDVGECAASNVNERIRPKRQHSVHEGESSNQYAQVAKGPPDGHDIVSTHAAVSRPHVAKYQRTNDASRLLQ